MRLPTLFKQKKINQYSYTPRYYNERKERLESLKEKSGNQIKTDKDYFKGYRKGNYRAIWTSNVRQKSNKKSQHRLILITLILLMIAYVIIKQLNINSWL